ncbi:hypothetical protein QBC39DRAFT_327599 [Podospora conica]|nr:hypothetical protein QBC39DRAFT_327599 [Schizothecium conicum]
MSSKQMDAVLPPNHWHWTGMLVDRSPKGGAPNYDPSSTPAVGINASRPWWSGTRPASDPPNPQARQRMRRWADGWLSPDVFAHDLTLTTAFLCIHKPSSFRVLGLDKLVGQALSTRWSMEASQWEAGMGRCGRKERGRYDLHRKDGEGTTPAGRRRLICGWRHNHHPACCQVDLAHRLDLTAPQTRQSRRPHSLINPETPPAAVEQEVKDASRQDALTHSRIATQHHHTPRQRESTHTIGPWWEPRHAAGGRLGEPTIPASGPSSQLAAHNNSAPQPVMSRPPYNPDLTGSQAHRLETGYEYAQYWTAQHCGLVMESLTHETADPSPSTRTTTACAPSAS